MKTKKSITYLGHSLPSTTDPYELAGELMNIDDIEEGNDQLADLYFQKAESIIKKAR